MWVQSLYVQTFLHKFATWDDPAIQHIRGVIVDALYKLKLTQHWLNMWNIETKHHCNHSKYTTNTFDKTVTVNVPLNLQV